MHIEILGLWNIFSNFILKKHIDDTFNVELMILQCLLLICIMSDAMSINDFSITFQVKMFLQ